MTGRLFEVRGQLLHGALSVLGVTHALLQAGAPDHVAIDRVDHLDVERGLAPAGDRVGGSGEIDRERQLGSTSRWSTAST